MESHMEKEFILGQTAKCTKESGSWASKKDKESGKVYSGIRTLASGGSRKQLATESINGKMEINMKVNGETASSTDKAQIYSQTETYSLDHTDKENLKDLANTNGKMAAFISVSSSMDLNTAKESGESVSMPKTATCMKETMRTTRKTAWGNSLGKVAIIIKGATRTMRGMAMEKCTGKMDPVTRASGKKEFNMALEECSSQTAELKKVYSRITRSKVHKQYKHHK